MKISRGSLAIAATLSLFILCSGCAATQHGPAAVIPAGASVGHTSGASTIPAGTNVAPAGTKHFAGAQ